MNTADCGQWQRPNNARHRSGRNVHDCAARQRVVRGQLPVDLLRRERELQLLPQLESAVNHANNQRQPADLVNRPTKSELEFAKLQFRSLCARLPLILPF